MYVTVRFTRHLVCLVAATFSLGDAVYNGVHREEALAASGSKLPVCDGSLQSRENEQAYFLVCDHACPSSRRRLPYFFPLFSLTWRLHTPDRFISYRPGWFLFLYSWIRPLDLSFHRMRGLKTTGIRCWNR